ncbi:laminin subunit alpha, partial [Trichonephila clavipes]
MFDCSSYDNLTPLAHADTSRDVLPRGGIRAKYIVNRSLTRNPDELKDRITAVIQGNNITIVHDHIEQPADGIPFTVEVSLIEHEFHHISGREVTREQMMMVLVNFEALLIRGSYFQPVEEI